MYCGCATSGGKQRWAAVVIMTVAAIACFVTIAQVSGRCQVCDSDGDACSDLSNDTNEGQNSWETISSPDCALSLQVASYANSRLPELFLKCFCVCLCVVDAWVCAWH